MYFHWAAFWGWTWDGVVIALMTYWTRHDNREWKEEEREEDEATSRARWRARPLRR